MLEFGVPANPHLAHPLINSSPPSPLQHLQAPLAPPPASKRTSAGPVTVQGLHSLLQPLLRLRPCLQPTREPSIHQLLSVSLQLLLLLPLSIISQLLRLLIDSCLVYSPLLLRRCARPDHRQNETVSRCEDRKTPLSPFPQNIGTSHLHTHDQRLLLPRSQQRSRRIEDTRKGGLSLVPASPAQSIEPSALTPDPNASLRPKLDASSAPENNPRINSPSQQPTYPATSTPTPEIPIAAQSDLQHPRPHHRRGQPAAPSGTNFLRRGYAPPDSFLQSPFRNRAAAASNGFQRPLRRLSAARLWNPTNSTPRFPNSNSSRRRRRPSTPPPPAIPLSHPVLNTTTDPTDPVGTGTGDYPLLTLAEQRHSRHSFSGRGSLQVERNGGGDRVSLPRSVRHSYDEKRKSITPSPTVEAGPSTVKPPPPQQKEEEPPKPRVTGLRKRGQSVTHPRVSSIGLVRDDQKSSTKKSDKGKGKAVMPHAESEDGQARSFSKDLERGPDVLPRQSTTSMPDGIGSAISSSNSSIMGDPDQQADDEEWGPQHPCYPHLNPHVPIDSPEYATTRIIRVRRDWLLEGDLAPTFSNMYPEILDPAGLSEQEFRRVIDKLNSELVPIFNPYSWRNILDGVLGVATGWLWEDFGFTNAKSRLRSLEKWIERWNIEMEKTLGTEDGVIPPKIVPLRRTAYMTLDIQIFDPEILPAQNTPVASRSGIHIEPPQTAVTS